MSYYVQRHRSVTRITDKRRSAELGQHYVRTPWKWTLRHLKGCARFNP
jgi:hypothetical protein